MRKHTRTEFPAPYGVVCFVFNELMREVIARFVDIGGIVDDHFS
jgi:hypothetical protein